MFFQDFIQYLIKGVLFGLLASVPVGPVAVLCIQRTLNKGRLSGFISGLGAAIADLLYTLLATFGIKFIINWIDEFQKWIKLFGSIVLIIMGVRLIPINPSKQFRKLKKSQSTKGYIGDFISTFGLTLSNPILFILYAGFLGAFFIDSASLEIWQIFVFLISVFIGACIWWGALTLIVSLFRHKIKLRNILIINRIAGVLIIIFAIVVLVMLFLPEKYQF